MFSVCRYQFIENNGSSPQEIQPEAEPQRPIMTLPPRMHNRETTSVKTKEVDLKNQEREAARGDRGEGEEKRKLETIRPAPEDSQSEAEPASKTSVPRLLDECSRATGVLSTRKNPMATGAIQATRSPASFPHPTTQKSQMLKASNFKSEPRWDFEEEYSLATGSLQTVSLGLRHDSAAYHHSRQPFPPGSAYSHNRDPSCARPDT